MALARQEGGEITTITAIVPAAGCGARAALNGNKILAPLGGKPLLYWTLRALNEANFAQIVVVARQEEFGLIQEAAAGIPIELVEGGTTRQESVFNGVRQARGELVLVHDAARPCISHKVIEAVIEAAQSTGGAIAALPATDTVKRAKTNGQIDRTLDRSEIYLAQTPQVFKREPFLQALEKAQESGYIATDCASVMEEQNIPVQLVAGDPNNLKVTFAPDIERAEAILRERGLL